MNKTMLDQLLKDTLSISESVGKLLLRYQSKIGDLKITSKKAQGVVSTADYEAEKKIVQFLKKKYPQSQFLAEEMTYLEHGDKISNYQSYLKNDWLWIIDPLDGTNNFLNGLSYFAVSIALYYQGQIVLGVIHRPSSGEFFFTHSDKPTNYLGHSGARAQKLLQKTNSKQLKQCLLATGFITEKGIPDEKEFNCFKEMMKHTRGLRRMGSACLDMSYVARGSFDGFWERGLPPWDISAGLLICQNAGVKVTNYDGRTFQLGDKGIIAARSPVHSRLSKALMKTLA